MSRGKEVELTISSAKNIKNVNWRHGTNKAYAVVWVDPRNKCTTRVDEDGDTSPSWNERLVIPLPPANNDDDDKIYINIVHAGPEEDTKALIGSSSLKLRDVLNEVGFGNPFVKTLNLKRPSGRPQGKLDVIVTVLEPQYEKEKKKEKEISVGGVGTGLAIGAAVGVVGGIAISAEIGALGDESEESGESGKSGESGESGKSGESGESGGNDESDSGDD